MIIPKYLVNQSSQNVKNFNQKVKNISKQALNDQNKLKYTYKIHG